LWPRSGRASLKTSLQLELIMNMWSTLLETAIHAPSPHNVQPWRIKLHSETEADLLIEKRRTLPKEDVTGSFIILTMGLFIEALSLLAANRSHRLHYELYQAPSEYTPEAIERAATPLLPFARLQLEADSVKPSPYPDALFLQRRTSRLSLRPERVPAEIAQALAEMARRWGQRYEQVTDAATIERILACNTDALFADLNAPDYHDEIVEWFRFTARASRRTRDGLDYRCMNASRPAFWSVAHWPQLLQFPLTRPLLRKLYRTQLGLVPTIGMLAGAFWDAASAFESGRFLMHFWLELAQRDLYIHPYGNLVTNRRAARWCLEELGVPDIWLIFKIGYSNEPPQSYRRSVAEVLVA
jgi:nitroreductase